MDSVCIKTVRFTLRTLKPEDATDRYSRWFQDPLVAEHIDGAKEAHDIEALRRYINRKSLLENVLFLGIFTNDKNTHIGNLKFEPVDIHNHRAVLGIMIGDSYWRGRGVAVEVINAAGHWLHNVIGISELALGVAKSNVAAQKAYAKAGFVFDQCNYLQVNASTTLSMTKKLMAADFDVDI